MVVVSSALMALGETLTINVGLAAALGSAKIPTKTATVTATPATLRILCCNSISLTNYLSFLNKEVWNFADFLPESKLPSSIRNDEIDNEDPASLNEEHAPRTSFYSGTGQKQIPAGNSRQQGLAPWLSSCSEAST